MTALEQQTELGLARKPQGVQIPIEVVRVQKDAAAAFSLACNASGLDDKEIYLSLDIDAGTFSRIKKGTNTLDADLIDAFCDLVGNNIYLEWLAYRRGCTLVMIKSEAERRAEAAETENRMLRTLLTGRLGASQ
ncbi:MAG: transcriptional regulator [Rhodocyclales bacterium]|nr:transcriptional regulator [Rhodocyclales bacterium]